MPYWTPDTIAAYAKEQGRTVTPQYIRRLCRQGKIKASKPGRDWVIEDEEARRWIAEWIRQA